MYPLAALLCSVRANPLKEREKKKKKKRERKRKKIK
jgi:hypothetical protein